MIPPNVAYVVTSMGHIMTQRKKRLGRNANAVTCGAMTLCQRRRNGSGGLHLFKLWTRVILDTCNSKRVIYKKLNVMVIDINIFIVFVILEMSMKGVRESILQFIWLVIKNTTNLSLGCLAAWELFVACRILYCSHHRLT